LASLQAASSALLIAMSISFVLLLDSVIYTGTSRPFFNNEMKTLNKTKKLK
jgi:hypothetical protein